MTNKAILQTLEQRHQFLTKVIQDSEKKILQAPPGTLEIKKHGKSVQFFHRDNPQEKHGIYIPASDRKRAAALAQKRYLTRLLAAAKKEKRTIGAFLHNYDPTSLENTFRKEGNIRQSLIRPIELPDEEYIQRWLDVEYQRKDIPDESRVHYTDRHERVRSKSEVLIANALARAHIPYRYECQLQLRGYALFPDFTILRMRDRKEVYWEHLGLIDESDYRHNAIRKIHTYEENGIYPGDTLILSVESSSIPLNTMVIQRLIKHYIL